MQSGENVLIGGLIIGGGADKAVIIRGIGPSLTSAGVAGALRDPKLTLYNSAGAVIGSNDNWRTAGSALPAGFAPPNELEAAISTTLAPGAYTVVMAGVNGGQGIALLEVYGMQAGGRIGNIATRGKVDTGDNILIGGLIIGGNQPSQVVIRAIGPSLTSAGISGALADPTLELYNSNGSRIFLNDNWRSDQAQQITASSLAPGDDREAAIIATLQPGSYTAIVRGAGGSKGVALVEVYNLSR